MPFSKPFTRLHAGLNDKNGIPYLYGDKVRLLYRYEPALHEDWYSPWGDFEFTGYGMDGHYYVNGNRQSVPKHWVFTFDGYDRETGLSDRRLFSAGLKSLESDPKYCGIPYYEGAVHIKHDLNISSALMWLQLNSLFYIGYSSGSFTARVRHFRGRPNNEDKPYIGLLISGKNFAPNESWIRFKKTLVKDFHLDELEVESYAGDSAAGSISKKIDTLKCEEFRLRFRWEENSDHSAQVWLEIDEGFGFREILYISHYDVDIVTVSVESTVYKNESDWRIEDITLDTSQRTPILASWFIEAYGSFGTYEWPIHGKPQRGSGYTFPGKCAIAVQDVTTDESWPGAVSIIDVTNTRVRSVWMHLLAEEYAALWSYQREKTIYDDYAPPPQLLITDVSADNGRIYLAFNTQEERGSHSGVMVLDFVRDEIWTLDSWGAWIRRYIGMRSSIDRYKLSMQYPSMPRGNMFMPLPVKPGLGYDAMWRSADEQSVPEFPKPDTSRSVQGVSASRNAIAFSMGQWGTLVGTPYRNHYRSRFLQKCLDADSIDWTRIKWMFTIISKNFGIVDNFDLWDSARVPTGSELFGVNDASKQRTPFGELDHGPVAYDEFHDFEGHWTVHDEFDSIATEATDDEANYGARNIYPWPGRKSANI